MIIFLSSHSPQTCRDCEERQETTDECGCKVVTCAPKTLNCRPDEPEEDECKNPPEQIWTKDQYMSIDGKCRQCYSWNHAMKEVKDKDDCHLTRLPDKCYGEQKVRGK